MGTFINNQFNQFVYDMSSLNTLKRLSSSQSPEGIKQVAKAFEGVFIQMMMKSMRQTIPEGGLLNSTTSQFFTALFDQQIAQQASGHGFGLADMLIKQMRPRSTASHTDKTNQEALIPIANNKAAPLVAKDNNAATRSSTLSLFTDSSAGTATAALGNTLYQSAPWNESIDRKARTGFAEKERTAPITDTMITFVKSWLGPAKQASIKTGIPYEIIIAQAALETGWGQRPIKTEEGVDSHNYFGIKAGLSWQGKRTAITTTEYQQQDAVSITDAFRVYDNHYQALDDYIHLLTKDSRYQSVINTPSAEHAAAALQQANYATDPNYAAKLIDVVSRIKQINNDLIAAIKVNRHPTLL